MKKIINTFGFACLVLLLASCYDDKGNYDYHEIGEITIAAVEDEYEVISYRDILKIEPRVTSTDPNDVFEYYWTLDKKPLRDEDEKKIKLDTISMEKNLNYAVELQQGFYNLTLYVRNQQTDFMVNKKVNLSVMTPFSRGFYVLKELEGNSELDFHLSDTEKMENLLATRNNGAVKGKPVSLGMSFGYYYLNETSPEIQKANTLNIFTEEDGLIVKVEDMSTVFTYKSMYYGEPPVGEKPYYMFSYGYGIGYATSAGFYCNIQWGESSGGYGYPQVIDGNCSPSRYVISDGLSAYFFDEKNGRFLSCDWNGEINPYLDKGAEGENKEFKPNNIGHKLIYLGRCGVSKNAYAIFEDETDPGKRYLYTLTLNSHSTANPIEEVEVIDPALNLHKATMFTCNESDVNVIYSVVDNRIYAYDPTQKKETEIKPEKLVSGEEITCITHRFWKQKNDAAHNFSYLVIATHKDGKYKVYLYDLVGMQTYGAPMYLFEGTGKAVKLQYASPMMDGGGVSAPYYSLSF